ncbi:MAG: aromatic ring-hydroxylating dioxygenase subunit alpha, partial [Bacteroidota bacterium]
NGSPTPDGQTFEIDVHRYVSSERLAEEREKIFRNFPVVVGVVGQLTKEGAYFLHDLTGVPILVVKGKDGQIRAFLNMCRHRSVRLLNEETGQIRRNIVCPYHAWAYDTAGCLKGIFHPDGFEGVSSETHSLIELDCHLRHGLIFVVPNPNLKGTFNWDTYLAETDKIFQGFSMDTHVPHHFDRRTTDANWKLLVDGGLEAYHFKIAHAKTIGPYFMDNAGLNHENKLHSTILFPKKAISRIAESPKEEWKLRKYANILTHIFPNTIVLVEPDHMMVVTMFPENEGQSTSHSFMLIPEVPTTEKAQKHWDINRDIFWTAIQEDNDMAVLQQQSFHGHATSPMTIGSFEKL